MIVPCSLCFCEAIPNKKSRMAVPVSDCGQCGVHMSRRTAMWTVAFAALGFALFLTWDFWLFRKPDSLVPEKGDEPFEVSRKDIIFETGDGTQIFLVPKVTIKGTAEINIVLDDKSIVETIGSFILSSNSSTKISIPIHSKRVAGHCVMSFKTNSKDQHLENLFKLRIKIKVVHQIAFGYLSIVIGWLYFVMWSCCYYPQIYKNWRRRSVVGFSFDYFVLNFTGHICYFVFNLSLTFNTSIQRQFTALHPKAELPVKMNDVFFSCHAILMNITILVQILLLERGDQRVSLPMSVLVGGLWITISSCLLGAIMERINWMQFVYYLAYIKVGTTPIKYTPQVYMNYINKSTEGWAIHGVWLDAAGGMLSFLQMSIDAINNDDWDGELGNPGKLGLSIIAMVYCCIFVLQHYFIYANSKNRKRKDTGSTCSGPNSAAGSDQEHEQFNEKLQLLKQSLVHIPTRKGQVLDL